LQNQLGKAYKTSNIVHHLKQLEKRANAYGNGTRSVGQGYNISSEYVIEALSHAKVPCKPRKQHFKVPVWTQDGAPQLYGDADKGTRFEYPRDFIQPRYGGVSANVVSRPIWTRGTCEPTSFDGAQGMVALVAYPLSCDMYTIALNAQNHGVHGVVFYYTTVTPSKLANPRIRTRFWNEQDALITIPILLASATVGNILHEQSHLSITTHAHTDIVTTHNIVCIWESEGALANSTLVVGSHLDSVPAGVGMVDNASGAASVLEMALTLARARYRPRHRLAFAWWGAEELGLLGSWHFVSSLGTGELPLEAQDITLNLNFDMLASPNWIPTILDGRTAPSNVQSASLVVSKCFQDYFDNRQMAYEFTDMYGGSDFLPFLLRGIPSGGVVTGASEIKTPEQRSKHGGMANTPLDPCYHQHCDTLDNINQEALDVMSHAALYAVVHFAQAEYL
jgi:hypothetical protein